MERKETTLLGHLRDLLDTQKNDIRLFYSNIKLTLPSYLKTVTIGELRDAGAIIEAHLVIPREVGIKFRERANVSTRKQLAQDKLNKIQNQHREKIIMFYKEMKQQIPKEIRLKRLADLTGKEWELLGVHRETTNQD